MCKHVVLKRLQSVGAGNSLQARSNSLSAGCVQNVNTMRAFYEHRASVADKNAKSLFFFPRLFAREGENFEVLCSGCRVRGFRVSGLGFRV